MTTFNVTESTTTVTTTNDVTTITIDNAGIQGAQGASGVVSVTSPITNSGSSSSAIIGIDLTNIAQTNAANAFTVGGQTITNDAAATVPLTVKGASGQSANILDIQNSASTSVSGFGNTGNLKVRTATEFSAALNVAAASSSQIGAVIRGAASQSANLQEWQNSGGTALVSISSAGVLTLPNASVNAGGVVRAVQLSTNSDLIKITQANSGAQIVMTKQTAAATNPGASQGALYFRDGTNANTLKLVVRAGTAGAETTILDNIPTT